MKHFFCLYIFVLICFGPKAALSQWGEHVVSSIPDFYCGELDNSPPPPFPFFQMDNDTLKVLVVFCNFPADSGGNFDIPGTIYMQHWPGASSQVKPSWADSIICPTTTNVWNRSLTGLFRDASRGKFWLIGDVYPDLYIFEHGVNYYRDNGGTLGVAVKELLEHVDESVNFADYDRLDPSDFDDDNNRREPDGKVDFIFINFRFNNAHTIEGGGYSGLAKLGGSSSTFGGSTTSITLDGKQILAGHPGSGAIYEMWTPWHIAVPAHEFGEHYGYGVNHSTGLGSHNIQAGALASAYDREWLNWNTGIQYTPTSNTSITLRDFITTGDYIKIVRNSGADTLYIENRRRISYYASEQYKNWKWLASEPFYPHHPDSGLLIYHNYGLRTFATESANGRWNWQMCSSNQFKCDWSSNTFNIWYQQDLNRYGGLSTFDLYKKKIKDENCNTITGVDTVNYRGAGGDSNTCFDVGYNEVFSPWSNPPVYMASSNDSLTIEIAGRDENGDMIVNVYFTNILNAEPSKTQELVVTEDFIGSTETVFHPRLDWEHNLEPDFDHYKILRGGIVYPGVDPTYSQIATTSNNYFIDNSVTLYTAQSGSGACTYEYQAVSYRIVAVDKSEKESVRSERDTIWGYSDPCAPEERPFGNQLENFEYGLYQNYPNPFNPETIVRFSLKEQSFVRLKVYNVLGQEVETLINDVRDKGNYTVAFNAKNRNLSSGIYYYKLEVYKGSQIAYSSIKRMVLIK